MSFQQAKVATIHELAPGEMKQVKVGETEVLLARHKDDFFATSAHCSHYGAPLVDGLLHEKRVMCPWHHACFDITNGKHLDPPGCDGLSSYEVKVDGEDILITLTDDDASPQKDVIQQRDESNTQIYLIIGAGAAAQYAAEAMRSNGFSGRIIMITPEEESPYDRPNVSKEYLQDEAPDEWMPLRPPEFYDEHAIEIMFGVRATNLDVANNQVSLSNGKQLKYDKILLASGGEAILPDMPGIDLQNVFTLRSMADGSKIKEAAKKVKKVLIVGASFIGMESAWSLNELGCEVTVVAPNKFPFASLWGEEVGKMIQSLHEQKGINFQLGHQVKSLNGDQFVKHAALDNGDKVETDLVLIGVGVKPATSFIHGLVLADDGGVVVDKHFLAGKNVYAAGDIAHFPFQGKQLRIEHWRVACQHGRIAGFNMTGGSKIYESVPFFWTAQQGAQLRYVGHTKTYDDIIFDGEVKEQKFLAYYLKDSEIKAVLGLGRDREMLVAEELMRMQAMPDVSTIKKDQFSLTEYFNELKQ